MDKTIMYWENKGKLVPTRELIKTPEQIEGIRKAGVVNTAVLDAVANEIHAGMNTLEIDQICRKVCEENGGIPACLNYCMSNTSALAWRTAYFMILARKASTASSSGMPWRGAAWKCRWSGAEAPLAGPL